MEQTAPTHHTAPTESSHRWFVASGLLARAAGDPDEGQLLLDRAEALYRPGFFPAVRPLAALRARSWIASSKNT